MSDLTLTPPELQELTGYKHPCKQLETLAKQGYTAFIERGRVILARRHFEAVCAGLKPADQAPVRAKVDTSFMKALAK